MVRDLTQGAPWKHITALTLPLLLGNVFQASYNLADTMIVGRFIGPQALAGVGVASPIFNLLNALLIGLSGGSSILVAQLFGGKKKEELPLAVSTVLWMSLWVSLLLTLLGQLFTCPLLYLLKTPLEVFGMAERYLRVILLGLVCNVFYNQFSGLLRGLPMGLQQASISFGHVLMQGLINPFGTALIDGYTAASKVDTFAVMPIISLGSALSAFSAQNTGCKDYRRVHQGYRTGCWMTVSAGILLTILVTPFRYFWIGLFVAEGEDSVLATAIISAGAGMLAVTPLFYWMLGLIHAALNTMAGTGNTGFSMVAMIGMMLLRVALAWGFVTLTDVGETGIWWSFPISWAVTLLITWYYFGKWIKKGDFNHE